MSNTNYLTALENERGVIGSILLDPSCLESIRKILSVEDFVLPNHADAFTAACAVFDDGLTPDRSTIAAASHKDGFQQDEFYRYLTELLSVVPTSVNAEFYARKVREYSLETQLADLESNDEIGKREKNKKRKEIAIALDELHAGSKWSDITARRASEIDLSKAPRPVFFIEGFLPQGAHLLNAFSKVGKSRLLLQLLVALSRGEDFMGRRTVKSGCLYLALEDELMDYQSRLADLLKGEPAPDNLLILCKEDFPGMKTPTLDPATSPNGGLIEFLEDQLRKHPDIKIIGIDVFKVIRSKSTHDPTTDDNRDATALINLAARHKIAILIAHHVAKADMRSGAKRGGSIGSGAGTYSLSGTVIGEYEFSKDTDNPGFLVLRAGGRRIKEQALSLRDSYPGYEYMGEYDEVSHAMAATMISERDAAIIETIRYIYHEKVEKPGLKKWSGNASHIWEVNYGNPALPQMAQKPKRAELTSSSVLSALRSDGINISEAKNGTSGSIFSILAAYTQDSISDPADEE